MKLKNFGLKKGGFTLIELLVVIVIIGILATIAIASFNGYFAKARDAERTSALRNMNTIMQTARATEVITSYADDLNPATATTTSPDATDMSTFMVAQGGYTLPEAKSDHSYYYVYGGTNNQDFAFFVCQEDDLTAAPFIQGTANGVSDVTGANVDCDGANGPNGFEGTSAYGGSFTIVEIIE